MAGKPIRITFLGDEKDLTGALGRSETAMKSAADESKKAGRTIDSSFSTAAEGADTVASKGSQAAGALSGLGGLAATQSGTIGALGTAMGTAGIATQALADSGDLLNVITDSNIVKGALQKATLVGTTAATIATTAATKVYTAGQWLLNAALSANPIGALVLGLVALVGVTVLAYKKSETFRNIVNGAFGAVKNVVSGVLPTLENVLEYIVLFPVKIIALEAKMVVAGAKLIGGLLRGLGNAGSAVGGLATSIVNAIIDDLNSILPHSISINRGPLHFSAPLFPYIPHLANGGITTGPMLAIIGDNPGGREAVIPLNRADKLGRTTIVHVYLTAPVGADAYTIGQELQGYLDEYNADTDADAA